MNWEMEHTPIKQELFESIEAYLMGSMPQSVRAEFEEELSKDASLRAELELQREHFHAVEMAGLERLLKSVAAEYHEREEHSGGFGWGWLKYAAVVALMAVGALWWAGRPSLNEQLFAEYHVADPGLPVPMSAVDHPEFHDAMVAYKLGDLEEASGKWGLLLAREPSNDTLLYYVGQAELQMGNTAKAIANLRQVAGDGSSLFRDKARWYLYLAYLRMDDREAMKALGMQDDPVYGERARALEAELGR